MGTVLLQKMQYVVKEMANDFIILEVGDRIQPISYYQNKYQVARGTIQNAIAFLRNEEAIILKGKGHSGTFVEKINYAKLQKYCMSGSLLGVMPLSNSITSQGLATAFYKSLENINCDLVYTRGAKTRIQMVTDEKCQFAVCSLNAAEIALKSNINIKILFNFGPNSYMPRHVLVFKDHTKNKIEPNMKVAYDSSSTDQNGIIDILTEGTDKIQLVKVKAYQTISAVKKGIIDVGLWNIDEVIENKDSDLHYVYIDNSLTTKFSTAVLVIKNGDEANEKVLTKYIDVDRVRRIQQDVKDRKIDADF